MSELDEAISESIERANESKLNSKIAIFVAITATFMAICNIKGGNIVQNMAKAQSKAVNNWSYFQSKSTKQNLTESTVELLTSQLSALPNTTSNQSIKVEIEKKISYYKEKINRYEREKNEIKAEAESQEKAYDEMNIFDDQFDMTEAMLSIAIAMFGLTALTQKKPLFYFAMTLSTSGFLLGITAFMKISLHSEFVSNILG